MNPLLARQALLTRRQFFGRSVLGLGTAVLATLLRQDLSAASAMDGLPGLPHFAPKAKRVIYLFQNGAPSHVDLFDYKPKLTEWRGKQIPAEVQGGRRLSTMTSGQTARPCLPEITKFAQHGKSGAWVSDFLPHTAAIADDLCFVKSMHTEQINHAPAITFFLSGAEQAGRPSMGAWLTYGLGSLSRDLPAFVVMTSRQGSVVWTDLLRFLLGQRLSADEVPGCEIPRQRRSCPLPVQPRRHESRGAPGPSRRFGPSERSDTPRFRRPRDYHPHRSV